MILRLPFFTTFLLALATFSLSSASFCSKGWIPSAPRAECNPFLSEQEEENNKPLNCRTPVPRTASGQCICSDETTVPSLGCVHEPYICEERCRLLDSFKYFGNLGSTFISNVFAVFVTVVRPDSSQALAHLRPQVFEHAYQFQGAAFILQLALPRPSLDDLTRTEIDAWAAAEPHRLTILEPPANHHGKNNWALLLQNYMRHIRDRLERFEFVISFDSHIKDTKWHPFTLTHSFGLKVAPNLHIVGPNRRMEYHHFISGVLSSWDAICANGMSLSRNGRFTDAVNYRDYYFTDLNFESHAEVVHDPLDQAEMVDSCYGGLVIYKAKRVGSCVDQMNLNTRPGMGRGQGEEHVALQMCLRQNNMIVVFNPAQVVDFP